MKKIGLIIGVSVSALFSIVMGVGTGVAKYFENSITSFMCGTGEVTQSKENAETLVESDTLCQNLESSSIVLLKNSNKALPLAANERSLNVFGYGATANGFLLKGVGSGSSTISDAKKVSLISALTKEGFSVNEDILAVYNNLSGARPANPSASNVYNLAEPALSSFAGLWDSAKSFSDVAVFVISRDGGENVGEMPKTQAGNAKKTYLEISDAEQETLSALESHFGKVIVLLNTTNTMHCGFLNDEGVSAALTVGLPGQSGALAIPRVLKGEVNPSGKTADIMTYSHAYDPTYANNAVSSSSICYSEGIYYGYKWYETADKENYFSGVNNDYGTGYDAVVQYPFGYGLTYGNDFSWKMKSISLADGSSLTKESKITFTVTVTNMSAVAGKDVIELYLNPPYLKGGVEKAAVQLVDFAKTAQLAPGTSQDLNLSFSAYDLASYDAYDKNGNGAASYELDPGDYLLSLRSDSHTLKDAGLQVRYHVADDLIFDTDPTSKGTIENRFTGAKAYGGVPIDGSTASVNVTYLSRADFASTFPTTRASTPNSSVVQSATTLLYNDPYLSVQMPTYGEEHDLRLVRKSDGAVASYSELFGSSKADLVFDETLFDTLGDYSSATWEQFLNQLTSDETKKLVELGGFHTQASESIGKPIGYDYDGPAGFNTNSLTGNWNGSQDTNLWTAYPSESLLGCSWDRTLLFSMGFSQGKEGAQTAINGWYAPGVNLHRSIYTARNYEYYSEDGVLSGKLAARVIAGAKANGLHCYLKHLIVSEEGPNPGGVNTWLTEQNLRENYLKPFEIAVKEGGANAMMSAFNRLGASWCGADYGLLTGIVRNEWGFKGTIVTDWSQGGGIGGMNPRQGVRAGNDMWLNPNSSGITGGLTMSDAIDAYCARMACKNILYTFIDTHNYNKNFDDSTLEGLTKVTTSITFKNAVYPWWWWIVGSIDAVCLGSFITFSTLLTLKIIKNHRAKKKEDAA